MPIITNSFLAQKWRTITDEDNCSKITFLTDCQQLEAVNNIPAQSLLKLTVEIAESESQKDWKNDLP